MIRGLHGLLYSSDADASRAFIRDKLQLPFTDTGDGWLIFDLPEGDLGIHPLDESGQPPGTHDVSLYCDDIHGTVTELESRGVSFKSEVADRGYGLVTYLTIPGGIEVQLYEPKYTKRASKSAATAKKVKAKPRKLAARAKRERSPRARRRSAGRGSVRRRSPVHPRRGAAGAWLRGLSSSRALYLCRDRSLDFTARGHSGMSGTGVEVARPTGPPTPS